MSRDLPPLAALQQRFRAAVLGQDDAPVAGFVRAPAGGTAARIDVYRNTVQASLIDVLATAFPVTQRIVGEGFFAGLAGRFVATAPPRLPQLSIYGSGFADFISAAEVSRRLPYLPDVARLEWARGEAYFAEDAPALDTARLAALSPEEMEDAVLRLHPATRLIGSSYPIYRIWEVNQPTVTDIPAVDMRVAEWVMISRPGHHIVTRPLAAPDAALISAIMVGKNLAAAAAVAGGDFDLQQALQDHFINGTFRD